MQVQTVVFIDDRTFSTRTADGLIDEVEAWQTWSARSGGAQRVYWQSPGRGKICQTKRRTSGFVVSWQESACGTLFMGPSLGTNQGKVAPKNLNGWVLLPGVWACWVPSNCHTLFIRYGCMFGVPPMSSIRVQSLGSQVRVAPCTAYASGSRTEVGQKLVSGIGLILRIFSTFTCLTRDSTLVSPCARWGMVGNFLVLGSVSEWKHAGMKFLKLLSHWLESCWGSTSGSCGRPLRQMLLQGQSQPLLQCRPRGSRAGHTFAALTVCGAQRLWLMGTFVLALSSESTDLTSASSSIYASHS